MTGRQRPATEEELHAALARLATVEEQVMVHHDDDRPCQVLANAVDELMTARGHLEEMRRFIAGWQARLARK